MLTRVTLLNTVSFFRHQKIVAALFRKSLNLKQSFSDMVKSVGSVHKLFLGFNQVMHFQFLWVFLFVATYCFMVSRIGPSVLCNGCRMRGPTARLQCTTLHYTVQCTTLHYTVQCTTLHYTVQCTAPSALWQSRPGCWSRMWQRISSGENIFGKKK